MRSWWGRLLPNVAAYASIDNEAWRSHANNRVFVLTGRSVPQAKTNHLQSGTNDEASILVLSDCVRQR